jgi:CheY-like chemotaxis protein
LAVLSMTDNLKAEINRRILLADDNRALQEVVKRVAERRGHEIIHALSGASTLSVAIEAQPDVIVLDMEFPDADGRDVLRKLKAEPRTAHIPVVVWSGRNDHASDSHISLELGAADFITKTDAQQLVHELERVLLRLEESATAPSTPKPDPA